MKKLIFILSAATGAFVFAPEASASVVTTTPDASEFISGMARATDINFSTSPYGPSSGLFSGALFPSLASGTQTLAGFNNVLGERGIVVGSDAQSLGYAASAGRGDNILEVINGALIGDYRPVQLTSHLTVGFVTVDSFGSVTLQSASKLGMRVVTTGDMRVAFFGTNGSSLATRTVTGSGFYGFSSDVPFAFVVVEFSIPQDAAMAELLFDGNNLGRISISQTPQQGIVRGAFVEAPTILVGSKPGTAPNVTLLAPDGTVLAHFLAYDQFFLGGVSVGKGDLNGDGESEIVTASGRGRDPEIRIFDLNGTYRQHFFAYNRKFRGGVNVAVGDLDGDGKAEIVTAPKRGGGPQVRIFSKRGTRFRPTTENFFAYHQKFRGGVTLALGDVNGDGKFEIITAPERGGGPQVRVFSSKLGIFRPMTNAIMAYDVLFRGGVAVAAGDLDGDGSAEIVTVPRTGSQDARVAVFRVAATGLQRTATDFVAFSQTDNYLAFVTVVNMDDDEQSDIVVVQPSGSGFTVRAFSANGTPVTSFGFQN